MAAVPERGPTATYAYARTGSPAGTVHLLATTRGLAALYFDAQIAAMGRRFPSAGRTGGHGNIWLLRGEAFVACYFAGDISFAPEIPLDLKGTDFQLAVWSALREIPPATTTTYGKLAERVGRPAAARAVGAAVGQNPVSLYIPCHRVVGSSGLLTGYAGGVEVKRLLLDHERLNAAT
jgi:methylated-DNA-[protein]-cysteine S-methyltransferase